MEDSRKDKRSGEKGLSTPDPHVDGENGKKAMVYNTKIEKKKGKGKKKKEKKRKDLSILKSLYKGTSEDFFCTDICV